MDGMSAIADGHLRVTDSFSSGAAVALAADVLQASGKRLDPTGFLRA